MAREPCSELLKFARVVIFRTNDEPGRAHAISVAGSLHRLAADVRILDAARSAGQG